MLTVGDILEDQVQHPFVGREAELQATAAEPTVSGWRMAGAAAQLPDLTKSLKCCNNIDSMMKGRKWVCGGFVA